MGREYTTRPAGGEKSGPCGAADREVEQPEDRERHDPPRRDCGVGEQCCDRCSGSAFDCSGDFLAVGGEAPGVGVAGAAGGLVQEL